MHRDRVPTGADAARCRCTVHRAVIPAGFFFPLLLTPESARILQVNERQMCGDSTTLIRPNQCHTVTTG